MPDTFLVKGAHFRGAEVRELAESLPAGTVLRLVREPENEHDDYAIKALCDDVHIGYVQAEVAMYLADALEDGQPAKVVGHVEGSRRNMWPKCELC